MTLVSEIITDAYRQSNILMIGTSPTSAQQTEALRYLNRIVRSVFGAEVGEVLTSLPIGRGNRYRPAGYPWYDQTPPADWVVPKNTRLVLNLESAASVYLTPVPDDGSRFAINDSGGNLSTYNLTVYGNGQTIEGSQSLVLSTSGADTEWFFRADTGNWIKSSPLVSGDTFPFPEEFDDFFITLLAIRLNPAYDVELDSQALLVLSRSRTQIRSRYRQITQIGSELGLVRMPYTAADRDYWGTNEYYDPTAIFYRGLFY